MKKHDSLSKYKSLLAKLDDAINGTETIGMKLYKIPKEKRFPKIKKFLEKHDINPFATNDGELIWKHFERYTIDAYKQSLYD